MSASSSSEEEPEQTISTRDYSGKLSKESLNTGTSAVTTLTDSKANNLKLMLIWILDAVRSVPSKNVAKGISIQKIKEYLRIKHHLRKMDIKDQLRPALEIAIKQKMLLKTTGRVSVLIGSVKLNPAYREVEETTSDSSTEHSGCTDSESVSEVKQAEPKKRKTTTDSEKEGANKKPRK